MFFAPFPEEEISDYIAHGPIIRVLTVLSGSNYTQQCLAAPTRGEIDAAHAKRQWMDIGVPSVRNLLRIKRERTLLWIAIGFMSIPLHLL